MQVFRILCGDLAVVYSLIVVALICVGSLFCVVLLCVFLLCFRCLVAISAVCLGLAVPWVSLHCRIVALPGR